MRGFLAGAKTVVVPAMDPGLLALTEGLPRRLFGPGGEVWAEAVDLSPSGASFRLVHREGPLGEVHLRVPGRHNVHNALAAALAALALGASPEAISRGLSRFPGVGRRFERVGEVGGAWVVDDYAHHPTEVQATLEAALLSGRRVRVFFQPHRLLRTQELWEAFAQALKGAHEVVVLPVYTAGERGRESPEALSDRIAKRLEDLGRPARRMDKEEALAYARATARPEDLLLFMGAGDVTLLARRLVHEG